MAVSKKTAGNTVVASSGGENGAKKEVVKENNTKETNDAEKDKYEAEKETFIYIGPTVRNGALKTNAMLTGTKEEIKKYLKEILETVPQVERLVIPLRNLPDSKSKVGQKGTLLNKYYNEIVSINYAKKEE